MHCQGIYSNLSWNVVIYLCFSNAFKQCFISIICINIMNALQETLKDSQLKFEQFVDQVDREKISEVAIRRGMKNYAIKNLKIKNVTPIRAKKMYEILFQKYECSQTYKTCWLQNQRRIFLYALICYMYKNNLEIKNMGEEDFSFLHQMFPLKERQLIKFQSFSILMKENTEAKWSVEEDEILRAIIKEKGQREDKIEWGNISREFFERSQQKFMRKSKECRERWQNHLDPSKIKGKWDPELDLLLLKGVLTNGKKWSKIAMLMQGKKNEHMVKNRYKSLMHKISKQLPADKFNENDLLKMMINKMEKTQKRDAHCEEIHELPEEQSEQESQSQSEKQKQEKQQLKYQKKNGIKKLEYNSGFQVKSHDKELQKNIQAIKPLLDEKQFKRLYKKTDNNVSSEKKNTNEFIKEEEYGDLMGTLNDENGQGNQQRNQGESFNNLVNNNGFINLGGNSQTYGNKGDLEVLDGVIQNQNPTPTHQYNRYQSFMFDARSPAPCNMRVSPYPWTPTIFFVQDHQGQVSPQIGFGSFCAKFTNQMHKFIGQQNNGQNKN